MYQDAEKERHVQLKLKLRRFTFIFINGDWKLSFGYCYAYLPSIYYILYIVRIYLPLHCEGWERFCFLLAKCSASTPMMLFFSYVFRLWPIYDYALTHCLILLCPQTLKNSLSHTNSIIGRQKRKQRWGNFTNYSFCIFIFIKQGGASACESERMACFGLWVLA
jgi:hypothetical protein